MPIACARCCPAISVAVPATSPSSRPCSTPVPPTRSATHEARGERMKPTNLFVGSPVERFEDLRFLRGRGQYVDDLTRKDLLHAAVLRSAVAHGRIRSIDTAAARAIPGVHAVITAADMGGCVPIIPMRLQPLPEFHPFEQPVIA